MAATIKLDRSDGTLTFSELDLIFGSGDLTTTGDITSAGLTLSGLTPGSAIFAGAGGVISQDNSNLFWDDTNKRLEIGTGNRVMLAPLDITGDATTIEDRHEGMWIRGKTGAYIVQINVRGSRLEIGGGASLDTAPAMSVNYLTGKVGIGTTTPNAPLEVKGIKPGVVGGHQSGQLQVTGSVTDEFYSAVITGHNAFNGNTQLWYLGSTSASGNDDIGFINRQNAAMHFYTNNTSRMTIDAAGNVTLGTNELTCGSINRAAGTLTLEIAGTPVLSLAAGSVVAAQPVTTPNLILTDGAAAIAFGDAGSLDTLTFKGKGTVANQFILAATAHANALTITLQSPLVAFATAGILNFTSSGQGISFTASTAGKAITLTSPDILLSGEVEAGGATRKIKLTSLGGYAIKLTNKTGGNSVAGELVAVYSATAVDDAVKTALANSDEVMGITLDAGIADGSEMWVVVSGIANVLMDAGGSARGDRIISSATAGSADVWNTGGAVATHFLEIGHCIETRGGAGLAKCVLHFN